MSKERLLLVAKVLGWAVVAGCLTALGVFSACYCFLGGVHLVCPASFIDWYAETLPPTDAFERDALFMSIIAVLWYAPRGFTVGALCAFLAPRSLLNPFREPFLWRLVRTVMVLGMGVFSMTAFCSWVVITMIEPLEFGSIIAGFYAFVLLDVGSFGVVLWRVFKRNHRLERAQHSGRDNLSSALLL